MAKNGVNNLRINVTGEEVNQHLNGYCRESKDGKETIRDCFCDDQDLCNTANTNICPTMSIFIVVFLMFHILVNL